MTFIGGAPGELLEAPIEGGLIRVGKVVELVVSEFSPTELTQVALGAAVFCRRLVAAG